MFFILQLLDAELLKNKRKETRNDLQHDNHDLTFYFVIFFGLFVIFYNAVEIIKYLMHIKSTEIVIILFPDGLIETSRSFLQDVHFLSLMIDRLYFYFHVYWDVSIVMCFSDEEYVNKKLCTINQLLGCVFVSLK